MTKFTVGQIIKDTKTYKVIKRTEKTITTEIIRHYGKQNESIIETKKFKIRDWGTKEVFIDNYYTVEAGA